MDEKAPDNTQEQVKTCEQIIVNGENLVSLT